MATGMDTDIDHWGVRKAGTVSQHSISSQRFVFLEFVKKTLGFYWVMYHFQRGILGVYFHCLSEAAWQLEDVLHDVNIEVYPDKPRSSDKFFIMWMKTQDVI